MTPRLLLIACTLSTIACGCQTFAPGKTLSKGDSATDPWVHEAGTVARNERPVEKVNDPLGLREIFTSSKARDIERNLGVGD